MVDKIEEIVPPAAVEADAAVNIATAAADAVTEEVQKEIKEVSESTSEMRGEFERLNRTIADMDECLRRIEERLQPIAVEVAEPAAVEVAEAAEPVVEEPPVPKKRRGLLRTRGNK